MLVQKLKHLIGIFNLTSFEEQIISALKEELSSEFLNILENQFSLFNKVDRVLAPANDLPFGHTSFYWSRFGKAKMNFPKKFPTKESDETLATLEVYSIDDDNLIYVTFRLVHGFLFTIKYRSSKKKFSPLGDYRIQKFKFSGDWAKKNNRSD